MAPTEASLEQASLPPAELFDDEERQYAQEEEEYGGLWIARRTDGSVITSTEAFEDLHDRVCTVTDDDATPYTAERIFAQREIEPPK